MRHFRKFPGCSVPSRTSRTGLVVISMLARHANSLHVIDVLTLNTLLPCCSPSSHSAQSLCEPLTFTANSSLFTDGESLRAAMLPNCDGQPHTELMTYLRWPTRTKHGGVTEPGQRRYTWIRVDAVVLCPRVIGIISW